MIDRVRCGACHGLVKYKDYIYLDTLNTVIHQPCYKPTVDVKDSGQFEEIIHRHSFFHELKRK